MGHTISSVSTMPTLPFELLQNIFRGLQTRDKLQCQLTCKSWNEASLEVLYANQDINTGNGSTLLKRTLRDSPRKAKLIKEIFFGSTLYENDISGTWDLYDLLDHFLQHCPNIVKMEAFTVSAIFWTRLTSAAYNGLLPRLQCLPDLASGEYIEGYIYTALAFQKTLTDLFLCDQVEYNAHSTKLAFGVFWTLADRLKDFPELKKLKVLCHTNQSLPYLDYIIQACPRLVSLDVTLLPLPNSEALTGQTNDILIQPRHDIKNLEVVWRWALDNDNALKYMMKKFPSLNCLNVIPVSIADDAIADDLDTPHISLDVIVQFFHYMIRIPYLSVECIFIEQDLIDVSLEFIKTVDCHKRLISISYGHNYYYIGPGKGTITFSNRRDYTNIVFPSSEETTIVPHMELLKKAGDRVYKIRIDDSHIPLSLLQETCTIQQILHYCPNLRELALSDNLNNLIQRHIFHEHKSLESLTILYGHSWMRSSFLGQVSACSPKLKHLYLDCFKVYDAFITSIDMPYTSLKLLKWRGNSHKAVDYTWKFYLKLYTLTGEHFMIGDIYNAYPSTKECYENAVSEKKLCFDITCKHITELEITLPIENFRSGRKYALNK